MTKRKRRVSAILMFALLFMALSIWTLPVTARPPVGGDQCYITTAAWVPARITNASAGDTILTHGSNGIAGSVLSTMAQYYTHAGMVISSYGASIRHNTMDAGQVNLDRNWVGLVRGFVGSSLEHGFPGIISESTDQACGYRNSAYFLNEGGHRTREKSFACTTNDILLKPYYASDYTKVRNALSKIKYMQGHYRLFAYSNVYQMPYSNSKATGKGNMCSGTVFLAHTYAGNSVFSSYYSPAARLVGARALKSFVEDTIAIKVGPFKRLANAVLTGNYTLRSEMANQVVNCMTLNDCGNRSNRWAGEIGSGTSVSPDNLLSSVYRNPVNAYKGRNPSRGVTAKVAPVQKSGGYYKITRKAVPAGTPGCQTTNQ